MDIPDAVQHFGDQFDTFLFVDVRYKFRELSIPPIKNWEEVLGTRRLQGKRADPVRTEYLGKRKVRHVEPAWWRVNYRHIQTGRTIEICLRRGFGQYALQELADGSLGMFLHRGDSCADGGSGVCYLANRKTSHQPLSRLFEVIKRKLAKSALIGSDGSNTSICELYATGHGRADITTFTKYGLLWQRETHIDRPGDCRRTVVWRVSPCD
jgi:hypothetical protein